jgi:ATP-binding cassette, subfamily F, member 3
MGELTPTKGTVLRHPMMKIGYFSQHSVEELSKEVQQSALSYFIDHFERKGEKVSEAEARRTLAGLGLAGQTASDTPMSALSGGQKVCQKREISWRRY